MTKNLHSTEPQEIKVTSISSARKIGFLLLLAGIGFGIYYFFSDRQTPAPNIEQVSAEPQFVNEGELGFISQGNKDTLAVIDIEIADNDKDRAQGLMYRSSLPDSTGMLFVFDRAAEQTFWMKNTKISIDIMYIDANKKIVTIYKHQMPYSKNPIPSMKPAQYVLEVNAGFSDFHKISEGDLIFFDRNEKLTNR